MKIIKSFRSQDKTKTANVVLSDEILIVEFYHQGHCVGEIEYPNKSYHYVADAAENWCTGILTKETLNHYKRVA
jgi:hypothetical protein